MDRLPAHFPVRLSLTAAWTNIWPGPPATAPAENMRRTPNSSCPERRADATYQTSLCACVCGPLSRGRSMNVGTVYTRRTVRHVMLVVQRRASCPKRGAVLAGYDGDNVGRHGLVTTRAEVEAW